jgi:hypothetical protein
MLEITKSVSNADYQHDYVGNEQNWLANVNAMGKNQNPDSTARGQGKGKYQD